MVRLSSNVRRTQYAILISLGTLVLIVFNYQNKVGKENEQIGPNGFIGATVVFPKGGDEATLDNVPWTIEPVDEIEDVAIVHNDDTSRFIIADFDYSNGMGNQMFQLSGYLHHADQLDAFVIIPANISLRRAFNLKHSRIRFASPQIIESLASAAIDNKLTQTECCTYQQYSRTFVFRNSNIRQIEGYFQTPRYFHPANSTTIHRLFTFIEPVRQRVEQFMQNIAVSLAVRAATMIETNVANDDQAFEADPNNALESTTLVGIHIRHGIDITMNSRNVKHGHVSAPVEYYRHAMAEMERVYENVAFIICTDNLTWSRRFLRAPAKTKYYYCPGPREVDMAILTSCDALITSTGTFSWWSGYLNVHGSATVFYYKNWPTSGSMMDKMINKTEYFPSKWTPKE